MNIRMRGSYVSAMYKIHLPYFKYVDLILRRRLVVMDFFFRHFSSGPIRRNVLCYLASAWILGLVIGMFVSFRVPDQVVSMVRNAAFAPVSFVGIMSAALLPLLLSIPAAFHSNAYLLVPLSFICSFFYGFYGTAILTAFGPAGWLVRPLLIFSRFLMTPVIWFYWVRSFRGASQSDFLLAFAAGLLVGWTDYTAVSSFLAQILSL